MRPSSPGMEASSSHSFIFFSIWKPIEMTLSMISATSSAAGGVGAPVLVGPGLIGVAAVADMRVRVDGLTPGKWAARRRRRACSAF